MGITVTRGIRYAQAERFAAPELLPYQPGSELGTSGSISPQVPGMLEQMLGTDISQMSEDCLFLDVYAPDGAAPGSLPVLVWIHGGAYLNGSGSLQWYDGSRLATRGAVVVTINYRLGALGFLGEGNWGTLDQICALQWVQKNISEFGGDGSRVTIFGESAGGSAVISLMAAPDARGLFHRVWAMSPSINQLRSLDVAMKWQKEFLAAAGVSSLDEARTLSLDEILAAQTKVLAMESRDYNMFSPAGGGAGLPTDYLGAAAANPLPLSIGTNRDENLLFLAFDPKFANATMEMWHELTDRDFGADAARVRAAYETVRTGATPLELIAAVQTDHGFRRPAQRLSEARAQQGNPTWMYWFTWASQAFGGILGSAHALDIPFAFDNLHMPGTAMLLGEGPELQNLACRFADEIAGFSHTGEASWPVFDTQKRPTLRLDTAVELLHDPEPTLRAVHS
ncbi:MAG: carboxylesterase/lipase family protein [Ilumatobacteraceae bacterium]